MNSSNPKKKPIPLPVFLIFAVVLLGGSLVMNSLKKSAEDPVPETSETEVTTDVESVNDTPEQLPWIDEAGDADQAIVVTSSGSTAEVSMYEKSSDGSWNMLLETNGYVGEEGVGKASEDRTATPEGVYSIPFAFGILPDPGCSIEYTEVDDSYYWVDDPESAYYNKFVSTEDVECDWESAEHITAVGYPYNYVLPFDYNSDCIPGSGSAFFLHCTQDKPTQGCVTIPESDMVKILQSIRDNCVIIIH